MHDAIGNAERLLCDVHASPMVIPCPHIEAVSFAANQDRTSE